MGRTSKPLTIMVDTEFLDNPAIEELAEKGHTILAFDGAKVDMVLSPKAWRMTLDLLKYLPLSIRAARDQKYPKKGGKDA